MAKEIAANLGLTPLRAYPDNIFEEATTPNNTSVSSDPILVGETNHGLEIVGKAITAMGLPMGDVITIEYEYGDSFAESVVLYTNTNGAGALVIAAGTELFRFVPNTTFPSEGRITVTTDGTGTGTYSVWTELVSR
jgi:hypothetical protein